jgi:hypothetical protein
MSSDPVVLSAIVGASVSFLIVVLFNFVRESLRHKRARARRHEIWE